MTKPTPQPEMLIDMDSDTLRHPMWKPPSDTERLGVHIRAVRREIAKQLIPLDGRTDCRAAVAYCEAVYDMSTTEFASNFIWLLGQVQWLRLKGVRLLQAHPKPHERDINLLTRLCEDFAQAIAREIA